MTPPPPPSCTMHRHHRGHHQQQKNWWPEQLDVTMLRRNESLAWAPKAITTTTSTTTSSSSSSYSYAQKFAKLDLTAVERDLHQLMTSSVDWWPADYGHYGPFFIRYVVSSSSSSSYFLACFLLSALSILSGVCRLFIFYFLRTRNIWLFLSFSL